MSQAKEGCLVAAALALSALLAGCVLIPYTPTAESSHETMVVAHPERLRLNAGRKFISDFENSVVERDTRLQPMPGQEVLGIASPDAEPTLERLLDPATRSRIAPLELDYLVIVGDPVHTNEGSFGGIVPYFGLWGLGKEAESTSLWIAVVDARELSVVRQSTSKATGTSGMVAWFFGLGAIADTREGAVRGGVTLVVETIAAARSSGPVRVAFLTAEPIVDDPAPAE